MSENLNNEAEQNTEVLPEQETNNEQPQPNMAKTLSEVVPLDEDSFRKRLLNDLFTKPENSPEKIWLEEELSDWFESQGTPLNENSVEVDIDNADVHSEMWKKVYQDYLDTICYNVKTDSFSLNADKVNSAFETMYDFAAVQFANELSIGKIDKVIKARFETIPQLDEAYFVATIGRDLYGMMKSNEVKTSQIEVENKVQTLEDLHDVNVIDNEQMALGYHNIAIVLERMSRNKSEGSGTNKERLASYDYMNKALRLTADPQLIKTCYEYLPNTQSNKMLYVREACDRALLANDNDKTALYKIHTIYSKTLETEAKTAHFSSAFDENYSEALYHYQEAFNNANTKERKAKVLRNIAKLQKNCDKNASYVTRAELAEHYLTGKAKVRELLRLAADISKPEVKQALFESAANELIDSNEIKAGEKSLLLSNVIHNLRPLYGNDKTKLDNLDKLEKQHCVKPKHKEFSLARMSSKGHDYFS